MVRPKPEKNELLVEHGVFRGLLLFAAVATALWAFYLIFKPFIIPIAWALCLGAVTAGPYRFLVVKWRKPRLAALTMCLALILLVLGPVVLVSIELIQEAQGVDFGPFIEEVRIQFPNAYQSTVEWITQQGFVSVPEGVEPLTHINAQLQEHLPGLVRAFITGPLGEGALTLLGAPFFFLGGFLLAFVTLYFVYIESGRIRLLMVDLSPLSVDETDQILDSLRNTTSAAILGGIVVALIQGTLGGIMFACVGISSPMLWGVVMAGFSLLPFGGTAIVWVPAAVYLFLTGATGGGIFLTVFGLIIVGGADNLLRPWVLTKTGAKDVHPMLLFFAVLSGIGLFGVSGIVFGPLLLAMLTTMVRIYRVHFAGPRVNEDAAPAP